ncbi:nodulation protein NfeD [Infirmifilum lucidum]|uniref:Nodulation protein NfeD n=1 Tax=Infirmifilum lucidum TaxID=2776706 RepID=A0A7L9FJI6_9CREN|nr:nodulation protein NfeD [Infirmifilum lucidum]QOJ79512.1 nodulation protein NfeD [Infirmifilum lucidum]
MRVQAHVAILCLALALLASPLLTPQPTDTLVVEISGNIDEGKVYLLRKALQESLAGAVILIVDSYGGYVKSMDEMIALIKSCKCKVIAWVPPGAKAVSAATGIALASNKLYLGEGAVIGACKPVPTNEKIESYMVSRLESLLEGKGVRGAADIARKLVAESKTLTVSEAISLGIADGRANSLADVLRLEGLEGTLLTYVRPDAVSDLLSFITDPGVAILFMILGVLLLALEIHVTGFQGWGVAGAVLILLALYTFGIIGINLLTLILVATGAALILLELFKPGIQVFGLAGTALVVLAIILEYYTQPYFSPSSLTVAALLILGALVAFIGFIIFKASETLKIKTPSLEEKLIGKIGTAKTEIRPGKRGVVVVESEEWTAESDEEIHEGEKIVVIGVYGLILRVRRAGSSPA